MRRLLQLCAALALAVPLLLLSRPASAAKLVLLQFEGRKAEVLRGKVRQALEKGGHEVVLADAGSESVSARDARSLAAEWSAAAVVGGEVKRQSMRDWVALLSVRDAATGELVGEPTQFRATWLPGLTRQLLDTVSKRLAPALADAEAREALPQAAVQSIAAPVGDPPREAAGKAAVAEDTSSPGTMPGDGALFRLVARGGVVRREIDFADDLYGRLRTMGVNMAVYHFEGALYPFARPVGERLGLIASFEGAFTGTVQDRNLGLQFGASFQEFFAGLRARYPVDSHEVGFDLTFGQMRAALDDVEGQANLPDVSYSLVRTSLHGTVNLGGLRGVASAGFRLPLGYGEMSEDEWFPRVSGYGVEATLGLQYPITQRVIIEASGSLRRFVLEMNSEPEDAVGGVAEVAGGAVDLYAGGYLGVAFRL